MLNRSLLLFTVFLPVLLRAAPPPNDNFAARSVLTTGTAATSSTAEATLENNESTLAKPLWLAPNRWQKSVWWKWTAPAAGWYQATTSGSAADTVLTVSTGSALNALTLLQANDQDMRANSALTSELLHNYELPNARILFPAAAGTEYQLAVATSSVDAGSVRLKVEPAAAPSPRITALSISPATVDANSAVPRGTAVVTIVSQTPFLKGSFIAYNRANGYQARLAGFSPSNRTAGNEFNGTYNIPFSPQVRSPAGTLEWQMILEADGDSEISSYGLRGQIPVPAGMPASVPMINSGTPDTTAPVIESCDITPVSHDVTTTTKSSTATVRATDAASGVKIVIFSLLDSTGREFYRTGQSFRTSGTTADGIYSINLDFPYYWKLGSYSVRVRAEDSAGNVNTPTGPGLPGWPGSFTGTIDVTRTNTVTMSGLTFTPPVVDVSNGPQTVIIDAAVTATSGSLTAATFTLWPAMAAEPLFNTFAPEIFVSSGNPQVVQTPTGWHATLTIPRGYPPGLALLGIQCSAGSQATYFGPRFNLPFPAGSPAGITVINDTNPDIRAPKVDYLSVAPDPMVRSACVGDGARCTIRITDDSSGIPDRNGVSTGLRTASFSVLSFHTAVGSTERRSGDSRDGIYSFFMLTESTLHAPLNSGDYILETNVTDAVGRKATVNRPRDPREVPLVNKVFKLVTAPAAYQTWANDRFPGAVGTCVLFNFWAPYADSDNDGAGNLTEAYFGTNPTAFDIRPAPLNPSYLPATSEISATWTEPVNTPGLTVLPQWSPDLTTWLATAEATRQYTARTLIVESLGAGPAGTIKRVRMNAAGLPKAWLRLMPVPGP